MYTYPTRAGSVWTCWICVQRQIIQTPDTIYLLRYRFAGFRDKLLQVVMSFASLLNNAVVKFHTKPSRKIKRITYKQHYSKYIIYKIKYLLQNSATFISIYYFSNIYWCTHYIWFIYDNFLRIFFNIWWLLSNFFFNVQLKN